MRNFGLYWIIQHTDWTQIFFIKSPICSFFRMSATLLTVGPFETLLCMKKAEKWQISWFKEKLSFLMCFFSTWAYFSLSGWSFCCFVLFFVLKFKNHLQYSDRHQHLHGFSNLHVKGLNFWAHLWLLLSKALNLSLVIISPRKELSFIIEFWNHRWGDRINLSHRVVSSNV